jgi:S-methylmethionine-dependent homocysteine/selenocysteine methylase
LLEKLRADGIDTLTYKAVPHIFHDLPAEEDLYALYRSDAELVRRDASKVIDMRQQLPFSKGRKWCINKAKKHGVIVGPSEG